MINTVIFDMGGTIEDIWYTDETTRNAWEKVLAILNAHNLDPRCPLDEFGPKLMEGIKKYKKLRPHVKEMLTKLKELGYRISVISNTASIYSVFDVLEEYGIRDFMEDVTLSSVTGYRKPNTEIFKIALREMRCRPEECCYVGDTISRDIIGATRAGFGKTVKIESFLSNKKDKDVKNLVQPDFVVKDLMELVDFLENLKKNHN